MRALGHELDRLRRGIARRDGARRARRWHAGLLAAACVLAFLHRVVIALPGLAVLEGHLVAAAAAALVLFALGVVLRRVAVRASLPAPASLARRLDDAHRWHDDTSTAVGLRGEGGTRVGAFLAVQTAGRLGEVAAARPSRPFAARAVPIALAVLFAFLLVAPGIRPLLRGPGPGGAERPGLGPSGGTVGARPLEADWFLMTFVEDPLPVEPLPEDDDAREADVAAETEGER